VVPAVALLVVVAEAVGGVPGTTHPVRQFAAWALQFIMQFVTVEVCASRILPSGRSTLGYSTLRNGRIDCRRGKNNRETPHARPLGSPSGHHSARMLAAHDLFGKPASTFPDHARNRYAVMM
jgi:hypothetical protein